jgi:hypothetical protein
LEGESNTAAGLGGKIGAKNWVVKNWELAAFPEGLGGQKDAKELSLESSLSSKRSLLTIVNRAAARRFTPL